MRKSGLHKQISSIFDGVPVPQNSEVLRPDQDVSDPNPPQLQPQTEQTHLAEQLASGPREPQTDGSSLVRRLSADPSECTSAPSIQIGRPMPLPKSAIAPLRTGPNLKSKIRKTVLGSTGGAMDAKQKKMVGLIGILSVVFGAVMFTTLGGVGKSQAQAGQNQAATVSLAGSAHKAVQDWVHPQPLPADLRDATLPYATHSAENNGEVAHADPSGLTVKGILFSNNKPSAIINSKIVTEGQMINGVQVVKITKESVEFQANEKRWTQTVQR